MLTCQVGALKEDWHAYIVPLRLHIVGDLMSQKCVIWVTDDFYRLTTRGASKKASSIIQERKWLHPIDHLVMMLYKNWMN